MDDRIKIALQGQLTVDPVTAGAAFGLKKNAAYRAVQNGEIPGEKIGGKWACPTAPLRRRLGLDDAKAA